MHSSFRLRQAGARRRRKAVAAREVQVLLRNGLGRRSIVCRSTQSLSGASAGGRWPRGRAGLGAFEHPRGSQCRRVKRHAGGIVGRLGFGADMLARPDLPACGRCGRACGNARIYRMFHERRAAVVRLLTAVGRTFTSVCPMQCGDGQSANTMPNCAA